jgi:hypothetical protein
MIAARMFHGFLTACPANQWPMLAQTFVTSQKTVPFFALLFFKNPTHKHKKCSFLTEIRNKSTV